MVRGKAAAAATKPRQGSESAPNKKASAKDANGKDPIELAQDTLRGDVRDSIVTMVRQLKKPWEKMTEWEQESVLNQSAHIADKLVRRSGVIIAARGFTHIPVSIGKFSVDAEKGIQSSFGMSNTDDNLLAMGRRLGTVVLLVPTDIQDFLGERKKAEPDVVGDLAMPKTGPGAPSDEAAMDRLARGGGDGKVDTPHDPETGEVINPPAAPAEEPPQPSAT